MGQDQNSNKLLVILDANAIIHRAFHALPHFTSSKGEPTGALYGFTSIILKIIKDLKPNYLTAAYDLAEPTFRHLAYENYKAQRPKTPDELGQQIYRSKEILAAFSVPVYEKAGFEADDIIGTIVAKLSKNKNVNIIIASGDLDTLQLVENNRVRVYTLRKGIDDTILYNEELVKNRFGFEPKFLADYKGLKGDPSDNIIGIRGIGEKTASQLIKKYKTLENLFSKIKKGNEADFKAQGFKTKTLQLLKENEEEAMFSKELVKIRIDAAIDFDLEKCNYNISYSESVQKIFNELGFRTLSERLKQMTQ